MFPSSISWKGKSFYLKSLAGPLFLRRRGPIPHFGEGGEAILVFRSRERGHPLLRGNVGSLSELGAV